MTSNVRFDVNKHEWYVMTSKTSSWRQKVRRDINVMMLKLLDKSKIPNTILVRLCFKTIWAPIWHSYYVSFPSYRRLCVFLELWPIPVLFLDNADIISSFITMVWYSASHRQTHAHKHQHYNCNELGVMGVKGQSHTKQTQSDECIIWFNQFLQCGYIQLHNMTFPHFNTDTRSYITT